MKPIWQLILTLSLVIIVECQKFQQQEQYPFPPHFQTPSSSIFSSDSTIYLPPESSTPLPYYSANNINKYPIKFLPPTAIKAPSVYPTPYPMVSSTLRSDLNEGNNLKDISKLRSSPLHHTAQIDKNLNNTENIRQQAEKREMRTMHRVPNFQQKFENLNHFDNVDLKKAQYPAGTIIQTQNANQNPASRRMIVTSEIQRNENALDQVKSASFANAQYVQAPGVIIASTAEPAIPILRLSNEMDLDGSFSYEALGADQTHYVQHSRMENMGTEKEEQVVEGSYSYVGDNGQTYTVHYVADSNGYRASGDHLPVAPPIPEIIQRAIQYNLAEEARKPPHLKQSWENEGKDYENDETSSNHYSITALRNLFTGRTPEAFSVGFSQGTNTQNNLVSAASSNIPVKTGYDIISEQLKPKSNTPITPQITFLASQGAHNPSSQAQQVASRLVSTEKSPLPQLVNYEAGIKESEPEANKGLWRWQYGLPTNDNSNANKNTISRSSGVGDDVIINFNDMTPEQYTRMIHSQISDQQSEDASDILDNTKINNNYKQANVNYALNNEVNAINANNNNNDEKRTQTNFQNLKHQDLNNTPPSTENLISSTTIINSDAQNNEYNDYYNSENHQNVDSTEANIYSKIISRQNFLPKSNIVTQTYNFEDITNDISQVEILKNNPGTIKSTINEENIIKSETKHPVFSNNWINNINEGLSSTNIPMHYSTTDNSLTILELLSNKNDFKPVTIFDNYYKKTSSPTTTETSVSEEQLINENIFLKNLLNPKANEHKTINKFHNNSLKEVQTEKYEPKEEKVAKTLEYQPNIQNEIKFNQKKPFDINDVLNYVTLKNNFESSKTKPKNIASINFSRNFDQKDVRPVRYIPNFNNEKNEELNIKEDNDSYQVPKNNQQKELHGVIKNYKVLQRQRNAVHPNNNHFSELPHRNIKTFHGLGLPPLGRAGPSLKSYLPPTFL